MVAYWDTAATTPVDPRVADLAMRLMTADFGNAGSRTHDAGAAAHQEVTLARRRVAAACGSAEDEVVFTSGATESNNLALLGLGPHGEATGRRHILSTAIEHKAVLEPLAELARRGFTVELVRPDESGRVDAADLLGRVREDTLLVSIMHANNETGVLQPVEKVAAGMEGSPAFLHVDAAQTFGKIPEPLLHPRIDLVAASAHKVFGPKGVGALIARRRGWHRPPLSPLVHGGGQERGLRPGTLAVPLIAAFGLAVELALAERDSRRERCRALRAATLAALMDTGAVINGDPQGSVDHIANVSFPGVDSEALMLCWRDLVAVSNGSACSSARYEPSHVLTAMGLPENRVRSAVRLSWWHDAEPVDWSAAGARANGLLGH